MSSNDKTGIGLIIVILAVMYGAYLLNGNSTESKILTKPQKTLTVSKFYDGKEGYFLSVEEGNTSTCIWTYIGGSAAVPGSITTTANNATQKHKVYSEPGLLSDWKVTCINDFGDQFSGVFPSEAIKK